MPTLHSLMVKAFHAPLNIKCASVEREYQAKGGQQPRDGTLTAVERGAGECGSIQRHINLLPEAERLTVIARYAPADEAVTAVRALTGYIMPKISGLTYRRMVTLLLLRYFGVMFWVPDGSKVKDVLAGMMAGKARVRRGGKAKKNAEGQWQRINLTNLAEQFQVHKNTMTDKRRSVDAAAEALQERADTLVFDSLTAAGYLGDLREIIVDGPIARNTRSCARKLGDPIVL